MKKIARTVVLLSAGFLLLGADSCEKRETVFIYPLATEEAAVNLPELVGSWKGPYGTLTFQTTPFGKKMPYRLTLHRSGHDYEFQARVLTLNDTLFIEYKSTIFNLFPASLYPDTSTLVYSYIGWDVQRYLMEQYLQATGGDTADLVRDYVHSRSTTPGLLDSLAAELAQYPENAPQRLNTEQARAQLDKLFADLSEELPDSTEDIGFNELLYVLHFLQIVPWKAVDDIQGDIHRFERDQRVVRGYGLFLLEPEFESGIIRLAQPNSERIGELASESPLTLPRFHDGSRNTLVITAVTTDLQAFMKTYLSECFGELKTYQRLETPP
ncbi:MAG: hypothetical protein JSW54_02580 [Fidelibacterota bacterium]|nr:MAG: hypothetical protein JSW54_02580 [Candidatus Neomarinimicrobiota bacterium]